MSEVVNVVVALAVIVFVFRWATSSSDTPADRTARVALGFKPKNITPEMLETVSNMFPDMPKDNIRYDLLRTGNVELTTNKIIERGYLDAPPPGYYRIYPRTEQQPQTGGAPAPAAAGAGTNVTAGPSSKTTSLISRFELESRLVDGSSPKFDMPEQAGGKATWESTPEQRDASLRERKAQMILAARKRLLEQQKAAKSD